MNNSKYFLSIIFLFFLAIQLSAQTNLGLLTASLVKNSGTSVSVSFSRNGMIPAGFINPISVSFKIPSSFASANVSYSNGGPVALSLISQASGGDGFNYFTFQGQPSSLASSSWNSQNIIEIGTFSVLNAGEIALTSIFNSGSTWIGTSALINGDNLVSWPVNSSTLLLITLKSLTAQKFDESSALLEWTSASEVDASHYEVERSFDAQAWSYVSTERVRGGNKQEASYTYLDRLGLLLRSKPNIVYYRLKLVDLDGSYKYSDVRSVAFEELEQLSISLYPNPASGQFNFGILSKDANNTTLPLTLTDMTGKTVLTQNVTTNAITTISTVGLPAGVYHAHVTVDGQSVTKKVVVSN